MNIQDMRVAVKTATELIADLKVYNFVNPSPNPPCAYLMVDSVPPTEVLGNVGFRRPSFVFRLLTVPTEAGSMQMDDWLSTGTDTSVLDALEAAEISVSSPTVRNHGFVPTPDGTGLLLMADVVFDGF